MGNMLSYFFHLFGVGCYLLHDCHVCLQWDTISVAIMGDGDETVEEVNKLKESIASNLHASNLYQLHSFQNSVGCRHQ